MTTFPSKIKFIVTGITGELQNVNKDKTATYEYLSTGTVRIGKVSGKEYANPKEGQTLNLSLEQIEVMDRRNILIVI